MKILQVNCVYKEGSTGKIVADLTSFLRVKGHQVSVAFGGGRTFSNKQNEEYKFTSNIESHLHTLFTKLGLSLYYGGMYLSTVRLLKVLKQINPDVVHLHCINGSTVNIYKVLCYLGKHGIPTLVTHHAEFYYTGSCGHAFECGRWAEEECRGCECVYQASYSKTISRTHEAWKKMKKSFATFGKDKLIFTAVSPWVKERSKLSPIVNHFRCEVVKNGVDTKIFHLQRNRNLIKERVPNCNEKIIFHSTASFKPSDANHNKGGYYVVELAKRMPNVTFVVASIVYDECNQLPSNLFLWGRADNQEELAELYSSADVTLIASKRETFSMICAESLCCGTPVVGFRAGGPETIAIPEYSRFVEYGNVEELQQALKIILEITWDKETLSKEGQNIFDKDVVSGQYLQIYKQLTKQIE